MLDPRIQAYRSLARERAFLRANAKAAVAAAELEQELILGVRVSDEGAADEIHCRAAEVALQDPDWLLRIDRHGGHTRSFSLRCDGVLAFALSLWAHCGTV